MRNIDMQSDFGGKSHDVKNVHILINVPVDQLQLKHGPSEQVWLV